MTEGQPSGEQESVTWTRTPASAHATVASAARTAATTPRSPPKEPQR